MFSLTKSVETRKVTFSAGVILCALSVVSCSAGSKSNSQGNGEAGVVDATVTADDDSKNDFVAAGDSSQIGGTNLTEATNVLKFGLLSPSVVTWSTIDPKTGSLQKISETLLSWPIKAKFLPLNRYIVLSIDGKKSVLIGPIVSSGATPVSVYSTVSLTSRRAGDILSAMTLDPKIITAQSLPASALLSTAKATLLAEKLSGSSFDLSILGNALTNYAVDLSAAISSDSDLASAHSDSMLRTVYTSEVNEKKVEVAVSAIAEQTLFAAKFLDKNLSQKLVDPAYYVLGATESSDSALLKSFYASYKELLTAAATHTKAIVAKDMTSVPASTSFNAAVLTSAKSTDDALTTSQVSTAIASFVSPIVTNAPLYADNATSTAPSDPSGFSATADSTTQITLTWTAASGASSYQIAYQAGSTPSDCSSGTVLSYSSVGNVTSKVIAGLTVSTNYGFRICSYSSSSGLFSSGLTQTRSTSSGLTYHTIFVTSTAYTADLGGISGADAKCQVRAAAAGLSGTWKAMISSASTAASSHISITMPIYNLRPSGSGGQQLVAFDATELWSGTLSAAVGYDEFGSFTALTSAWTGSSSSGAILDSCQSWTSVNGADSAYKGDPTDTAGSWFSSSLTVCSTSAALYCINGQ